MARPPIVWWQHPLLPALVGWLWPLGLLVARALAPRWYTLDDWRETLLRVLFFTGMAVTPVAAGLALWWARRSEAPRARWASMLATAVLVLLTLGLLVGLVLLGMVGAQA